MFNIIIPISISIIIAIFLLVAKMFQTKIDKRKIYAILAIVSLVVTAILYISLRYFGFMGNISQSGIDIGFSNYSGIKEKEIVLNSDINSLKLDGAVSLDSGVAVVYVKVKDTNEILYSKEYSNEGSKSININIDDLDGNSYLVLGVEAENVEGFKLSLESSQKLVKDKEIQEVSKPL